MRRSRGARAGMAAGQRGFTLLEVIVAFSVLALALALLLGALSGGTRQVRWSADAGRAALLAQSLLDQTGVGEALRPGRSEGVLEGGRYRWTLEVEPYDDPAWPRPATGALSPRLMHLRLTMTWGEGGPRERLQLATLRLVQPGPEGALP
jgi:general secretion pathway protein I